jgi:putative ABC transport system substrate-binding protein
MAGLLLAVSVRPAWAQEGERVYRVAFVHPSTPVAELRSVRHYRAFFDEFPKLGYVEGQNLMFDLYSGDGNRDHYADLARDVVQRKPDVIFTLGGPLGVRFKSATGTIPIVLVTGDPVAFGFAASLARPGGNITGVSVDAGLEIWSKRLALLKEAVSTLSRIGCLTSRTAWESPEGRILREAAQRMGIPFAGSLLDQPMHDAEYRRVIAAMSQERVDAIVVHDATENFTNRRLIVELVEKARLPAIYPWREPVELGGLMAYATDLLERYRYAAHQIDQILKGAKPGEIPFYQPTRYELLINLKSAKSLRLTFPPSIMVQADEVIE